MTRRRIDFHNEHALVRPLPCALEALNGLGRYIDVGEHGTEARTSRVIHAEAGSEKRPVAIVGGKKQFSISGIGWLVGRSAGSDSVPDWQHHNHYPDQQN